MAHKQIVPPCSLTPTLSFDIELVVYYNLLVHSPAVYKGLAVVTVPPIIRTAPTVIRYSGTLGL